MTKSSDNYPLQILQQYTQFFESMMTPASDKADSSNLADEAASSKIQKASVDVEKLIRHQFGYLEKQYELWQSVSQAMQGEASEPVVTEEKGDRRFGDEDWTANPLFSFIKQSYLLNSRLMTDTLDSLEFEDDAQSEQLKFMFRQYVNALSPSNTLLGNPEVYRKTLETDGENIHKGIENLLLDLGRSSQTALKLSQTDEDAFEVGETLAITPGSVVYQNEIMQLIQYAPTTKKVYKTPILITPPFMNKYYVLDMDEEKSLVRWLVSKGFTVFMISWVNPDAELAHKGFGDYAEQGPVEAIGVIKQITGADKVNLIGYCVGGTLTGMTAALLKAQGKDDLASLTLLTTLLDFSKPGELGHYFSDSNWPALKEKVQKAGYMDGRDLAMSFNMLRENQLFWPYFINNYLKGESPKPFDLLYWNGDSAHIPATNYIEYIESTYLSNQLREPGAVKVNGTPIDLSVIDVPVYFLAARSDHIVLWDASYLGTQLLSGPTRFVLGGSGHLAGVINPEGSGKYGYWTNKDLTPTADEWLEGAEEHEGSWWPDWFAWAQENLEKSGDKMVTARKVGSKKRYPALEEAPGSYVRKRV